MRSKVSLFFLALSTAWAAGDDPAHFFESRIRPLFASNCYACHTATKLGGLRVDSREGLLKGGNSGPAIVPGDPEKSLLVQALRHSHEKLRMPPPGKLKDEEIDAVAAWVKAGAVWPETAKAAAPAAKSGAYEITPEQRAYWAFQPVRKPEPPEVKLKSWPKSSIDHFILAAQEARGLQPVKPATRRALLRRAYFDLIGLPPTIEEMDAFLQDKSPDAFAKVVDRLLASPHYGERWGRFWLDVARYSDDKLNSTGDEPRPNAFRYRDWVIRAFNEDMPYDMFVKAQIAGDLLPSSDPLKYRPGLGFYALSPEFQDDRVDATTRGFLALTVACAQCHDHKYDPIPTKDYYALLGVFTSTQGEEFPLAPDDEVKAWNAHKKKIDDTEAAIAEFTKTQSTQLGDMLAAKTARYLMATRDAVTGPKHDPRILAEVEKLDFGTLDRWLEYVRRPKHGHPFLKPWTELMAKGGGTPEEARTIAEEFERAVVAVSAEKKSVDDQNYIRLGGSTNRRDLSGANLVSLNRDKYVFWRDIFSPKGRANQFATDGGVLYYGDGPIDRFLSGEWRDHLETLRAELAKLKETLPPQFPFLHSIKDAAKPADQKIHIRGNRENLGDVAPRAFLHILCDGEPARFTQGSGRLELAEAIAGKSNPVTARVMANRIWQHHFGNGIVRTPSNFGQLGERPTHPELLDYLAARFMEHNWSIKAMHREIMLSATYALSASAADKNLAEDAENRLLWRANRKRLDVESMRDALLAVSGLLDTAVGGPAEKLTDDNRRRTVYGFVSRRRLDPLLLLFDFPNPNNTSERRIPTDVPLQKLFFMNSGLMSRAAEAFSDRLTAETTDDAARIALAYRMLYGRAPSVTETQLGLEYLKEGGDAWKTYAQVLLSSNEFGFVN
ncbi:MAG: PSD1 and planctomycete cytochrome C domain-containing protein [Bryobacteraceae bacterium]